MYKNQKRRRSRFIARDPVYNETKLQMVFEYKKGGRARSPVTDAATFRIDTLNRLSAPDFRLIDLSHFIDPSYDYHSLQELRWHLAERFGLAPTSVALREAA